MENLKLKGFKENSFQKIKKWLRKIDQAGGPETYF